MSDRRFVTVRPRVTVPDSDGAVLLADQVEMRLAERASGLIHLDGLKRSGRSRAIEYLNSLYRDDPRVLAIDATRGVPRELLDELAATRLVIVTQVDVVDPDERWTMARWGLDECIEYALARFESRSGDILKRFQQLPKRNTLGGRPELFCVVLEALGDDGKLQAISEAMRQAAIEAVRSNQELSDACRFSFNVLTMPIKSSPEELVKVFAGWKSLPQLFHYPTVQFVLAADYVVASLQSNRADEVLTRDFSPDLIDEAAPALLRDPGIVKRLWKCLHFKTRPMHAMAASLLHAARVPWTVDANEAPDLRRAKLPGIDWAGLRTNQLRLEFANLEGANLSEARLNDVDAHGAQLAAANFHGAQLEHFSAKIAACDGADFSDVRAKQARFAGASLQGASFEGANLIAASFRGADLSGASFRRAKLLGAHLRNATIDGADFAGADLSRAELSDLKLSVANFAGATFEFAVLEGCDLEDMNLPGAMFFQANLRKSLLTGSRMPGANFRDADLRETGLADISWPGADLSGADLRNCTFHMGSSRSGLVDSPIASEGTRTGFYTDEYFEQDFKAPEEIRKADLRGAKLAGANIDQVDFYLVDLRDAEYTPMQEAHLRRCRAILETRV